MRKAQQSMYLSNLKKALKAFWRLHPVNSAHDEHLPKDEEGLQIERAPERKRAVRSL